MNTAFITANGKPVEAKLPCSLEEFLVAKKIAAAQRRRDISDEMS